MSKEKSSGHLAPLGGRSSVFSRESFHEEMLKKREANRSIIMISQALGGDDGTTRRPKVRFENTYRMEPPRKFRASEAEAIIKEVLEHYLKDEKYDPKASKQLSMTLAQIIKDRVKELNYERYKIVCLVMVGQIGEQGLRNASRFCWDPNRDTFASGNFKNKSLFGVATVYAVYQE